MTGVVSGAELHARVLAFFGPDPASATGPWAALRAIAVRHAPAGSGGPEAGSCAWCGPMSGFGEYPLDGPSGGDWPCEDFADVASAVGVEVPDA